MIDARHNLHDALQALKGRILETAVDADQDPTLIANNEHFLHAVTFVETNVLPAIPDYYTTEAWVRHVGGPHHYMAAVIAQTLGSFLTKPLLYREIMSRFASVLVLPNHTIDCYAPKTVISEHFTP